MPTRKVLPISLIHACRSSPCSSQPRLKACQTKAILRGVASPSRDGHDDVALEPGPLQAALVPGVQTRHLGPLDRIVKPAIDMRAHDDLSQRQRLAAEIRLVGKPVVDDLPGGD